MSSAPHSGHRSSQGRPPMARPIAPGAQPQMPPMAGQPALPPMPAGSQPVVRPVATQLAATGAVPIQLDTGKSSAAVSRYKARRRSVLPLAIIGLSVVGMIAAGAVAAMALLPNSPFRSQAVAARPEQPAEAKPSEQQEEATATSASLPVAVTTSESATAEVQSVAVASPSALADDAEFQFKPTVAGGDEPEPSAPAGGSSPAPMPGPLPSSPTPAGDFKPAGLEQAEQFEKAILDLYAAETLLSKKEYPALRKLFADRFAREHEGEIKQGLGSDHEAMMAWFAEHASIQEELYTAIRPDADKVPEVLRLFNELRKAFPEKIVPYANLAIATAVVWDDEGRGVDGYQGEASACKAILPETMAGALDNFRYLAAAENLMQGRIRYVPWEFLVHVVNHPTPIAERQWAMQAYLPKRVMFGKCYSDVPYDHVMLETDCERANLNGQPYTLPNIRIGGGICMIQADFAARVGKSLGVPAAYVSGQGQYGGSGHAWVMWVELKQATPTGLVFTLESHGRYRGDHYYVGNLRDPQTGASVTDRDLELRLQSVGADTVAKRHARLLMQTYPLLKDKAPLDTNQQLALLSQLITYSPGCEEAWVAVAKLAREVSGQKEYAKSFDAVCTRLFTTFARIPDFTWRVFDDLAAYPGDAKQRRALYERLIALYETANRPDLAAEARLKLTDYLVEENQKGAAIDGLALSIRKFPAEGQFVPKLLDRLEELIAGVPGSDVKLAQFYTTFLAQIPQKRNDSPSDYCIEMYERAIALFRRTNQPQLVQALELQLVKIKTPSN